jgi:hypothetical protein
MAAEATFTGAVAKAEELHERNETETEPTPEQREFMEYAGRIAEELGYEEVTFETWQIDPKFNESAPTAETLPGSKIVRLNTNVYDWESVNMETLGTLVHELSHIEESNHGREWYEAMEQNFAKLLMNRGEPL